MQRGHSWKYTPEKCQPGRPFNSVIGHADICYEDQGATVLPLFSVPDPLSSSEMKSLIFSLPQLNRENAECNQN